MKVNNSLTLQIALIFLFVLAVYYPSLFAPFTSIDDVRMINSLLNTDSFSLKGVFIPNSSGTYYRPLLLLTFIMDKYLWGLEASFMHLENILLHFGNSLLVYFLARQVFRSLSIDAALAPLTAALLFALHPLATESVSWVSGRTDLLAGFFVLASLLLFLKSIHSQSAWFAFFGALLLVAGCLSKETALFILPVMLLWSFLPPNDSFVPVSNRLRSVLFILFSTAGVCYLFLRWLALSGGDKIVTTVDKVGTGMQKNLSLSFYASLKVVLQAAGFYFKKLLFPLPLNFGIDTVSPHYLWLGLVVLAGVVFCLYRRDTFSYLFLSAFMLTSSAFILPILKITWTPYAERYLYIATAPFIIGVMLISLHYIGQSVPSLVTTLLVALLLGGAAAVTVQRNIIWQDNYTLYKDTMEKSPGFGIIVNEYAIALRERGQNDEADKLMLSNDVGAFQQSASLNRIRVLNNTGQSSAARSLLIERLDKGADNTVVMLELLLIIDESRRAKAERRQEQLAIDLEILKTMQKLLELTGDPFYHYRIGKIQLLRSDFIAAKNSFTLAWQKAPQQSHYREAARKLAEGL